MRVAVIDYGMGNVDSVVRAIEESGGTPMLAASAAALENATHLILPGVGSFAAGMRNIRERSLDEALGERVLGKGVPFLGICLGMQLLATTGQEGGSTPGLGWIRGEVRRLQPNGHRERVPHVGWNEVVYRESCPLFRNIPSGKDFYFVHSYVLACADASDVAATTDYCNGFPSAVAQGHIFGVQFHPEKSQRFGLQLLKNFLAL